MKGQLGGGWDRDTHEELYGNNLNSGLGDFILEVVQPCSMLEFGSGLCGLANYIGDRTRLSTSYCLEPDVVVDVPMADQIALLNVDVLSGAAPRVLDRLFDLILSIEVAEHVPRDLHEKMFDFLSARAGRLIVFSAARPGQGGHGHIAERPELEWREAFTSRGCRFDPVLTMRARNMCNQRNINHRQNVQVFHAPDRSAALLELEREAKPYLQDLLTIVLSSGGRFTGNLFYANLEAACSGRPEHSLHWKRENLRGLAARAERVLEVGFAAGHSTLLILLANPTSKLTIVDPLEFPHARKCFDYLASMFSGRLKLVPGYSTDVLSHLDPDAFDLVHLDGGKDKTIARDLELLKPLVVRDHVLCIDDTQNPGVRTEVEKRTADGTIDIGGFEEMNAISQRSRWTHCLARFSAEASGHSKAVFARMTDLFEDVDHPSIYTNSNGIHGQKRADYLIKAMRDAEVSGLTGAFVELGVAAGHSSVIAALAASRYFPRDFFLYDTFCGFAATLPDELDHKGVSIRDYDLNKYKQKACTATDVRGRVEAAGIAPDRLYLVEGPGEKTIPKIAPAKIAILRLDADLFDPTYEALRQLYDLVEPGGYVIIDDYGHWKGCAEATDRFFAERSVPFPGVAIDYTCYGWRV